MGIPVDKLTLAAIVSALALSILLSACGDDDQIPAEGPTATVDDVGAGLGGPRTLIGDGDFQTLVRTDVDVAPQETALIVAHVEAEKAADARGIKLRLVVDGEPLQAAEEATLEGAGSTSRVAACLCKVPADSSDVGVEVAVDGETEIASRSIVVVGNVEAVPGPGEPELPAPLIAAVDGQGGPIAAEPVTLAEATVPVTDEEAQEVLVVGAVRGSSSTVDLGAVQIDAVIGAEQVQPTGSFVRPGRYAGVYQGEVDAESDGAALAASTAAGRTNISATAMFVCACRLTEDAFSATPG